MFGRLKILVAGAWREATSLRSALILTVLAGVIIPASITAYLDHQRLTEQFAERMQSDLASTSELLAMTMREPLWQFTRDHAESTLDAALSDTRIVSIEVLDKDDRPFVSRRRPVSDPMRTSSYSSTIKKERWKVGTLILTMDGQSYHRDLERALEKDLRGVLQTLLGSLALIFLVLRVRLINPINRLVKASGALEQGDLTHRISVGRRDELGQLARSMEATRKALGRLFAELEKSNADLRLANEGLESRVALRTRELEATLDTLRRAQNDAVETEKLASLGRIVAGVAHELNTPLGNALTVASTLNESLQPLITESRAGQLSRRTVESLVSKGDEGMTLLLRNLEKAATLISNFKQVAVDQTSEQRRRFDLAQVTEEVVSVLRPAFRKSKTSLRLELAPSITCDSFPGPYGQVITNLLMNALTHAFDGKEDGEVVLRTEPFGESSFRVFVEDNGNGMTDEVRKRIFDPFFTTRLGRGGSGLGMNIVQGFVTRVLNGRILIDSEPGAGTRIILELPLTAPEYAH